MADNFTIARPYAKAIFAKAEKKDELRDWLQWLQGAALLVKDQQMQSLISNPRLSSQYLAEIFLELVVSLFSEISQDNQTAMKNFISLLCENKRLQLLPDIAVLYANRLAERESTIHVEAIGAQPLVEKQKEELKSALEKRFNANVKIKCSHDESLIGGILIRANNWVMDGTVKGKLSRLSETLS